MSGFLSGLLELLGSVMESTLNSAVNKYDVQNRNINKAQQSSRYKNDPAYRAKVDERREQLQTFYDSHLTDEKLDQYEGAINHLKEGIHKDGD